MTNIVNEYINTDELNKLGCKKYIYKDEFGNLVFSCELNENGDWVDTTDIEKLKIEIAQETAQLNKMINKEN